MTANARSFDVLGAPTVTAVSNAAHTIHLAQEYSALLARGSNEQVYQRFIEAHTELVPRDFVLNHGIWGQVVLRKLAFGAKYKCDFAFVTKSSVQWRCVFVEIERPDNTFFRGSTSDFHSDFDHAIHQIDRWRAWFRPDPHGRASELLQPLLTFPQVPDPVEIRFVLVYGRRAEFESVKIRRSLIESQQREDLRIMSFDSLSEDLASKDRLYTAAMHNEYIELLSDDFICDTPFYAVEPEELRASRSLLDEAKKAIAGGQDSGSPPASSLLRKQNRKLLDRIERVRLRNISGQPARSTG